MKLARGILLAAITVLGGIPAAQAQEVTPSPAMIPPTAARRPLPAGETERAGAAQRDVALGRLGKPPALDGVLGEGEWQGAARAELLFQVQPGDNATPSERTEVLLAADREHLYIAFR